MRGLATAAAIALALPSSAAGQACSGSTRDSVRVLEVAEGIIAADNHRDLQTVLDFYAHEAVLLPPGEPAVHGVAAIRPRYEALFESFEPAIVLHVGNVSVCGDLAVVSGRNEGALHARSGAGDRALNDTFVMVLRKTDAAWRITRLMWHPREGG